MQLSIHTIVKVEQQLRKYKTFDVMQLRCTDMEGKDNIISIHINKDDALVWEAVQDVDCTY